MVVPLSSCAELRPALAEADVLLLPEAWTPDLSAEAEALD
jgi:hypothetical protein